MPGRPHHSEKMKSCVSKVMAQGHSESSAYAICTTSLKESGRAIYTNAEGLQQVSLRAQETAKEALSVVKTLGGKGSGRYPKGSGKQNTPPAKIDFTVSKEDQQKNALEMHGISKYETGLLGTIAGAAEGMYPRDTTQMVISKKLAKLGLVELKTDKTGTMVRVTDKGKAHLAG